MTGISPELTNLARIHSEYREAGPPLDRDWARRIASGSRQLFDSTASLDMTALREFRRRKLFLSDAPPYSDFINADPRSWFHHLIPPTSAKLWDLLAERFSGGRRGDRKMLIELYRVLEAEGALDLLQRHPVDVTPGGPFVFRHRGCAFNARWGRHIHHMHVLRQHCSELLVEGADPLIMLDLGCAYGGFSAIVKRECPGTTHVLVDLPDMLLLAYYFLRTLFPLARIATLATLPEGPLSRQTLASYDFVLLPTVCYRRVAPGAIDLMTNFFSLGEMPRQWFDFYLSNEPFLSTPVFHTSNRMDSASHAYHDTDVTLLDYRLHQFESVHFAASPLDTHYVVRRGIFWHLRQMYESQMFEFIGKRTGNA